MVARAIEAIGELDSDLFAAESELVAACSFKELEPPEPEFVLFLLLIFVLLLAAAPRLLFDRWLLVVAFSSPLLLAAPFVVLQVPFSLLLIIWFPSDLCLRRLSSSLRVRPVAVEEDEEEEEDDGA